MDKKKRVQRRSNRFRSEPATVAFISFKLEGRTFEPDCSGLVIDEAVKGCHLLALTDSGLQPDMQVKIKVGHLPILRAQIVWTKPVGEIAMSVGIQYL